ncbi:hypothetical protein GT50_07755 [Geobacillus stearothermophilus 10]|nr:hypothetical protein GT50_07755 [Geobacillus stearothermophilus 10]
MGDLSFRMLGDTFILLEIRQQGLFLCLSEFYLAPRVFMIFIKYAPLLQRWKNNMIHFNLSFTL